MREGLGAALLALVLCASPALATPPAPEEVPQEETTEEVTESDLDSEEQEMRWGTESRGYQEVQNQAVNLSEEDLRVTVFNGMLRPARGYFPVEVVLHNQGATSRVVRIGFEAHGSGRSITTRQVEVGPRQRLSAWLPAPVIARGGVVSVRDSGNFFRSFNVYSVETVGQPVLVLGSEQAFQSGTRLPREKDRPKLSVRFVSQANAPRELAAYVGHALVVVAGDVTTLPADIWSALEAYASTGGYLVLLRPPRDVAGRLPLLAGTSPQGVLPYGFGRVRLCGEAEACGSALLSDADEMGDPAEGRVGIVVPAGLAPSWQGGGVHVMAGGATEPLLPGVQAPVGRFLCLIILFVLAVGPGGLFLARRKGPVALLIAVPSVALVTCLAIVAWSVLVEGFSVHAARYGLVLLDRERDRALTVGLGGYYANLEPEGFQLPVLATLLGPDTIWESQAPDADWTNGMSVTGGFLPSRTYREWGEVAVVPTRARLSVRREGQGLRVQNALGAPLVAGFVRLGGSDWELPALADGEEGEARQAFPASSKALLSGTVRFSEPVMQRFFRLDRDLFSGPLPEGGFVAKLEGPGLAPTSVLPVELHEGLHFVRGRVDGP